MARGGGTQEELIGRTFSRRRRVLSAPPWHYHPPPVSPMRNLSPTVQRLIVAFTTGLFLACAAGVSTQSPADNASITAP